MTRSTPRSSTTLRRLRQSPIRSLKTRDLKGYSGLHRAPSTDAKTAMMREAADDVEKWMIEHRDDVPLCRSLTSVDEILTAMPEDVRNIRGARNRVAEVLTEQFNGESLGKVRLGGRLQPRLWAIHKRSDVSVRDAMKDGQLAQVYRNERWTPPTTLTRPSGHHWRRHKPSLRLIRFDPTISTSDSFSSWL